MRPITIRARRQYNAIAIVDADGAIVAKLVQGSGIVSVPRQRPILWTLSKRDRARWQFFRDWDDALLEDVKRQVEIELGPFDELHGPLMITRGNHAQRIAARARADQRLVG